MSDLLTVPLDKIDVGDDFNPRRDLHLDDGFVDSVRTHGVLTPILVHPQGSGEHTRYFLVAGERRYRAALQLGLPGIAAVVRTSFAEGNALPAALVENMQRAQLTPIEEARAFQRAIGEGIDAANLAAVVGVSEQLVKERVALLELPGPVQEKVGAGDVTLRVAKGLAKLAAAGEQIVVRAAEMIARTADPNNYEDEVTVTHLEESPDEVVGWALEELEGDEQPFLVDANGIGTRTLAGLPWPDEPIRETLLAKAKQLPEMDASYKRVRAKALEFAAADVDAARAYGCLLEFDGVKRDSWRKPAMFVTDPVWLADRLGEKLDKAIAAQERKNKTAAKKAAKEAGVTVDPNADADKIRRAAVRAENAAKAAALLAARERNLSLGIALYKGLHAPELTEQTLRPIAELVLTYAGADLGRRGLRFVDESAQSVTTRKDGTISKVSHRVTNDQAEKLLARRLRTAKTPNEIVGVILQALAAARFADVDAATTNDRYGHVRGLDRHYSAGGPLPGLIDAIAEPHLPADVVAQLRELRAQEQAEAEESIREEIKGVRDGWQTCPACGNTAKIQRRGGRAPATVSWEACECTDEQIGAAIDSCPRCGEPDCFATCSAFEEVADVVDEEQVEEPALA